MRGGPAALEALLRPRSIAVVGASATPGSFGQRLLASVTGWRYPGAVFPVNPRYTELAGLACYPTMAALPEVPDCAALAVSDERIEAALSEAAGAGVRAAVMFGRGYEAPVPGRPSRSARLGAIAREAGMAVCGNNCMGFMNFRDGLKVSGNPPPVPDRCGVVGLVSHSGSTWSGLIGNQRQLYFNYAISAGQEIATSAADYLEFLLDQPETRVIGCLLETVRDPARFVAALEEADRRGVPVVVLKLGRSERGQRFALAHSGALSGADAAYQAVFERYNICRVQTVDEFTDTLELLSCERRPPADAIGVVTDSGGERELIVDLSAEIGAPLAEVGPETSRRLAAALDPGMLPVNPVDAYGDGRLLLEDCLKIVADDPAVGVAALATNLVDGRPYLHASGAAIQRTFESTRKPVVVFGNLHSAISRPEAERLRTLGIPVLMGTPTALVAMTHFLAWHRRRREAGNARERPAAPAVGVVDRWRHRLGAARGRPLDAAEGLALFADFGVPVAPGRVADSADSATRGAAELGFPVALKTANPDILHKTEAGGVALGLADAAAVGEAWRRLAAACGPRVLVQAQAEPGTEILLGLVTDPQFGPMLTVGLGGIFAEVLRDVVTLMPPVTAAEAQGCLARLKGYPLLTGARGRPPADLAALAAALERFSVLCAALGPHLSEMDLNPLIAGQRGAVAVDALVVPRPADPGKDPDRHGLRDDQDPE